MQQNTSLRPLTASMLSLSLSSGDMYVHTGRRNGITIAKEFFLHSTLVVNTYIDILIWKCNVCQVEFLYILIALLFPVGFFKILTNSQVNTKNEYRYLSAKEVVGGAKDIL